MPPEEPRYAQEVIWKYQLSLTMTNEFMMPLGADIVHVGEQHGAVCIWALVNPVAPTEFRVFHMHGTGHPLLTNNHIATVPMKDGYVWHVFEV